MDLSVPPTDRRDAKSPLDNKIEGTLVILQRVAVMTMWWRKLQLMLLQMYNGHEQTVSPLWLQIEA